MDASLVGEKKAQCRGEPLPYWQRIGFLPDFIPLEVDLARDSAKAVL